MKLIGLTGGIASGKSTVSRRLVAAGVPVIDADVVAREVVASGTPGLAAVSARFEGVLNQSGTLDRQALATRVFSNETERAALNAIVHPLIRAAVAERAAALAAQGAPLVIYDAALLIENNLHHGLDGVILVAAQPDTQIQRLVERDGLTPAQAQTRLAAQWPLSRKRPEATWVIENDGSLANTERQIDELLLALKRLA